MTLPHTARPFRSFAITAIAGRPGTPMATDGDAWRPKAVRRGHGRDRCETARLRCTGNIKRPGFEAALINRPTGIPQAALLIPMLRARLGNSRALTSDKDGIGQHPRPAALSHFTSQVP